MKVQELLISQTKWLIIKIVLRTIFKILWALLELIAGKRSGSVMAAILQNPETLKDAFESASEASGSALIENEKYMESIQGHLDILTNKWQERNNINRWKVVIF